MTHRCATPQLLTEKQDLHTVQAQNTRIEFPFFYLRHSLPNHEYRSLAVANMPEQAACDLR
jgi:hypothetical protein